MSDGPVVGIAGASEAWLRSAVESAGGTVERGGDTTVTEGCEYVVAVGEAGLLAAARAGTTVPVLPVGTEYGPRSVAPADGPAAVEHLLGGDYECEHHPLVEVTVGDRLRARVALDAMLVTADPAEISEYSVHTEGARVARFRADGVVVATPAGSGGYARRAGGPVVGAEAGVVSVVPVAPFATETSHWILALSSVELSVERGETPVHLLADDRVVGEVTTDERVCLVPDGTVTVAVVPESRSAFDR